MKLLITQREMQNYGGSQLYTAEIARALVARGHEVALYTPKPGKISKLVSPSGVAVRDSLSELPFTPDLIHGHHHLPLMAALAHFDKTPAVHCWHGVRPWVERVPLHPRIRYYVATAARMGPQITAELGIPEERIVTIPNFVDTGRFSHVRTHGGGPLRRAVLYGHGGFHPAELRTLEEACHANGMTLDKVGYPYNNPRPRPEYFLPDYDIVFAIGRSALEALACGCAVIPIVPQLAGHMITTATLDEWTLSNYSPRYFTSADRFGKEWLREELRAHDAEDVARVTATVRDRYTLDKAIDTFEELYRKALTASPSRAPEAEFGPYMEWLANEVDDMWSEADRHAAAHRAMHQENVRLQGEAERAIRQVRFLMETVLAIKDVRTDPAAGDTPAAQRTLLAKSGLFDVEWYLETYPEVAEAGMDAIEHYLNHGAFEGRNPSASFDGAAYLEANPHLKGMGISPLEHFIRQLAVVDLAESTSEQNAVRAVRRG